ncbi:hypothetical protein J4H63_19600 [Vibrio alginolyticus]|uniref:tetratricopeptide repeat protein n=1 Tax=Vibrio alginolyticus TaxID=663 RepID=UPI001BD65616|nr:hypothetical protein [Vibrio alginolyticus]MBS9971610.1 hypothetical protein [Vibrio alginolyticus]
MRWKEMLVGALVTLAVTVIGGLVVYYTTQEDKVQKVETLTYQKDEQVSFHGKDNKVSIGTLKFANIGGLAAKNVKMQIQTEVTRFIDFNIASSSGAAFSSTESEDGKAVTVVVPSLLPNEIITVTYLLDSKGSVGVSMRSDETIGQLGPIYSLSTSRDSILNNFLGNYVPLLLVPAVLILVFVKSYSNSTRSRSESKNNTAFVLLHCGLIDEAEKIFRRSIANGEGGSHCLANYAGALSYLERVDEAELYLSAARFLSVNKHEHAIVYLNEALLAFNTGDFKRLEASFDKALELSKKHITMYSQSSKIIQDIRIRHEQINNLL